MKTSLHALSARRAQILQCIASLGEMQAGSVVERYRRCGRAACHCAIDGSKGHGPQYFLSRAAKGRTSVEMLQAGEQLATAKAQVAAYRRFRALAAELIEVSNAICRERRSGVQDLAAVGVKDLARHVG